MPASVVALLIKYGVPFLITVLQKTGVTNWAEGLALKAGYSLYQDVQGTKTYTAPTSFPNSRVANPTPHNFTVGAPVSKTTTVP